MAMSTCSTRSSPRTFAEPFWCCPRPRGTWWQADASSRSRAAFWRSHFQATVRNIASKAGVEGLVHVLANELRGRNITVNAVAPGPVATDLFLTGKTRAQIDELSNLAP